MSQKQTARTGLQKKLLEKQPPDVSDIFLPPPSYNDNILCLAEIHS
jgi:hypothetical protein